MRSSMRNVMLVFALLVAAMLFTPSTLLAQDTVVVAQNGRNISPASARVTNQFNEAVTVYVNPEGGASYRLGDVEANATMTFKFKGYMMNTLKDKNLQFTIRPRGESEKFITNSVMGDYAVQYWINVGSPLTSTYVVVK